MLTLLTIIALAGGVPNAPHRPAAEPRTLTCVARNTSDGKDRKCHVKIPRGATVRSCEANDRAARHCGLDAGVVAWTSGENGARCELSKRKSDWKKRVAIKVAKETKPGTGSCTLFVAVR